MGGWRRTSARLIWLCLSNVDDCAKWPVTIRNFSHKTDVGDSCLSCTMAEGLMPAIGNVSTNHIPTIAKTLIMKLSMCMCLCFIA